MKFLILLFIAIVLPACVTSPTPYPGSTPDYISTPYPALTTMRPNTKAVLQQMQRAKTERLAGLKVTGQLTSGGFRFDLAGGGWLIVRFSGAEPLLRIYCETTPGDRVQELLDAGRELAGI